MINNLKNIDYNAAADNAAADNADNNKIIFSFSSPYKLILIKDNYWHQLIAQYYQDYKTIYRPINSSVTYLVFSGISFPAFEQLRFPLDMCDSYSYAFQVHQKPYKTSSIHKYFIKDFTYFWYLGLIALPVDIYAHTMQFLFGERNEFLEGGAFFIPYMVLHWTLLLFTLFSPYVYKYLPEFIWKYYFALIYYSLAINEHCYKMCIRRLSLLSRIAEFSLFCGISYIPIKIYLL